ADSGFKVSARYRFHEHMFLELGYADLGSATLENLNPAIGEPEALDYTAPALFAGYLLFDGDAAFNLYAKAGYASLQTDADPRVSSEQVHDNQLALGAGAQWRFLPKLRLQLDVEQYDEDARAASLMLMYTF